MKFIQKVKRRIGAQDKKPAQHGTGTNLETKGEEASAVGSVQTEAAKTQEEVGSFTVLPNFGETPQGERTELFRQKLGACTVVHDFNNDATQPEREAKRQTLLEMLDYVKNTRSCFTEDLMADVVNMVGANIFRALLKRNKDPLAFSDPEGDEPLLERAWSHLQIVYELFFCFIVSNDVEPKIAKRFVEGSFMLKFLELFDSEDPRERDSVKAILHRVYGKFMAVRSFVRRAIQHVLFKVVYECETHNGVSELLEILGSIIDGFALPLKEEHKDFMIKTLIPLHKLKSFASFYHPLSYCMVRCMEKDPGLSYDFITSLLRFWPVSITAKQVLFLNEIEQILELTQPWDFHHVMVVLFRRLALCIRFPHFQVAERALFFWNNDYIVKLINQNRRELFPIILEALYKSKHWNSAVHGLTFNVLKLLMEADPELFDECSAKHPRNEEDEEGKERERQRKWAVLQNMYDERRS